MKFKLVKKKNRPNYYAYISYYNNETGKTERKCPYAGIIAKESNKREAECILKEMVKKYEQRQVDFSKDRLFTSYLLHWFDSIKSLLDPVTYKTYGMIVKDQIIPYFQPRKLKLCDISTVHIRDYMIHKGKQASANTVKKHLINIRQCLDMPVND